MRRHWRMRRRTSVHGDWHGRRRWQSPGCRPQDRVLGADTIVVVDGAILGKPRDAADATRMLRLLSRRTHEVITGVCVVEDGVKRGWLPRRRG